MLLTVYRGCGIFVFKLRGGLIAHGPAVGETLLKSAAATFLKVFKNIPYNSSVEFSIIPLKVRFPSNDQKIPIRFSSLRNIKKRKRKKQPKTPHKKP